MLNSHPVVDQALSARIKTLNPQELQQIARSINPNNMQALTKLLPELKNTIAGAANKTAQLHSQRMGHQGPQQGQQPSGGLLQKFGFSSGGPALNRTGYANRGIPNTGFAHGGMAMPHVAPPPHAMNVGMGLPAEMKTNSRKYNTPTFAQGGLVSNYATGGAAAAVKPLAQSLLTQKMGQINDSINPNFSRIVKQITPENKAMGGPMGMAQPQGQGGPGLMANPEMAQKSAMQSAAMGAIPSQGKADDVPANLSKGEFVMCTPSVMWFGMEKLAKMQEKAHQGMVEHMAMQQMNQQQAQQQNSPPPPGQMPGPPPQQQQQRPQGFAAPPPGMRAAVANTNGAPMPNPGQQRIQATNTPRPNGPGALSPIQ